MARESEAILRLGMLYIHIPKVQLLFENIAKLEKVNQREKTINCAIWDDYQKALIGKIN